MKTALQIVELAAEHAHLGVMSSSAQLSLQDARACLASGHRRAAIARSKASLAYSVGILHPAYQIALDATLAAELS